MIFDPASLVLFLTASILLIIAPGPDIVFLLAQGVTRGKAAGVTTALGLSAGNLIHTLAAILGVSVIFQTSALAFLLLKWLGVAYLLFLTFKAIQSRNQQTISLDGIEEKPSQSLFWRGFLMNILNPKVALFFLAFLPQFTSEAVGPIWLQMLFYGVIFTVMVAIIFGALGYFAGFFNTWLQRGGGQRLNHILPWGMAGVYTLLAIRLALVEK